MCSCISPMASRILSFKASIGSWLVGVTLIFDGTWHIIVQRCQIAAPRWSNDISSAADNAIFKNRAQNIECSFGCVAHRAILLKPNVANILLFNFCEQKFAQHGPITIAIDCNGLSLLIFEGNGSICQTVTRFGCVGYLMYACGFSVPQMRQFCLFTYPPRSKWASFEKMIFLLKSATSVSRSQTHFPALFKHIHNHIRSAEG